MTEQKWTSFEQFYIYYLTEHDNPTCRRLHYLGSTMVLAMLVFCLASSQWQWLWSLPVLGYGPAWIGHFVFERNKPASFRHPFYSFCADWVMLKDAVTGQLSSKLQATKSRV